jgi:hypothetical protein
MKILHGLLTLTFLLVIFLQSIGYVWEKQILVKSAQPKNIDYGFKNYTLRIIKMKQILSSTNIVIVSRGADSNYGHVVSYLDSEILNKNLIKVKWSKDGVSVSNEFGTKIMIPKENFMGLR